MSQSLKHLQHLPLGDYDHIKCGRRWWIKKGLVNQSIFFFWQTTKVYWSPIKIPIASYAKMEKTVGYVQFHTFNYFSRIIWPHQAVAKQTTGIQPKETNYWLMSQPCQFTAKRPNKSLSPEQSPHNWAYAHQNQIMKENWISSFLHFSTEIFPPSSLPNEDKNKYYPHLYHLKIADNTTKWCSL